MASKKTPAKKPTKAKAPPQILCESCGKQIQGEHLNVLGKFWHPEHFTCAKCKKPITGQYNVKDNQLYCKADYAEMFLARCPKCGLPVTDVRQKTVLKTGRKRNELYYKPLIEHIHSQQALLAMDQTWHPDHFLCAKCGVKLAQNDNEPFCVNDGKPYCRKDYLDLFGIRCFGCKQPIEGTALVAMGEKWHPQCLKCSKCNEPLTEAFRLIEEKPVCQKCAK